MPYQDEEALADTGVVREQAEHAMVLVHDDGTRWAGGDAVARVIEDLPRGRLLGRLLRLPLIRHGLRLGYRLVADNRHTVSRLTKTATCEVSDGTQTADAGRTPDVGAEAGRAS